TASRSGPRATCTRRGRGSSPSTTACPASWLRTSLSPPATRFRACAAWVRRSRRGIASANRSTCGSTPWRRFGPTPTREVEIEYVHQRGTAHLSNAAHGVLQGGAALAHRLGRREPEGHRLSLAFGRGFPHLRAKPPRPLLLDGGHPSLRQLAHAPPQGR